MLAELEDFEDDINPLDSVEEIMAAHNWVFNRATDDKLVVTVSGKSCNYRLVFTWQEERNALQFCCQFDSPINKNNLDTAAKTLMNINENLWMGHFDILKITNIPRLRHTCLFNGIHSISGYDYIEELIDIALAQCERYYPVFHLLSFPRIANDDNLDLALMDISGEA